VNLRLLTRGAARRLARGLHSVLASDPRLARMLRPPSHYLGDHEALAVLHTGHRILLDTRDIGICAHLLTEGRWESWVEAALRRLVKPGMRVVDGGAHVGYYTLLMAQWVGEAGRVEAFEPNAGLAGKLRRSLAINGLDPRVRLHEAALWDAEGEAQFGFDPVYSGGGALGSGGRRALVQTVTLDSALAGGPPVDVLKLDIEGAESPAWRGAAGTLARSPRIAVVLEFHAASFRMAGDEPGGFLAGRAAEGFTLRAVEPAGLGPALGPEALLAAVGERRVYLQMTRGL
jgi:FkbM family methyltransferase